MLSIYLSIVTLTSEWWGRPAGNVRLWRGNSAALRH